MPHTTYGGDGKVKRTLPKPKDWSFRKPSEGGGKSKRKKVKLKHSLMYLRELQSFLAAYEAGLPSCSLTLTCANPARKLTATDLLRIQYTQEKYDHTDNIEVEYNEEAKVMHIVDISHILPSALDETKLGEGTL